MSESRNLIKNNYSGKSNIFGYNRLVIKSDIRVQDMNLIAHMELTTEPVKTAFKFTKKLGCTNLAVDY